MKQTIEIRVMDRLSRKEFCEKVYPEKGLLFLYEKKGICSRCLRFFLAKTLLPSRLFAYFQKRKKSRKKILPFIQEHGINPQEFIKDIHEFTSFEDFFIRQLKPECRPICSDPHKAILPADARYLFFENISSLNDFYIKGKRFHLEQFLQSPKLAEQYEQGAMVIARLAPRDYHRFHFPFDCIPQASRLINGALYSVSPIALRRNFEIFWENKRVLTSLLSSLFGEVLFIEVGATCVGKIQESFIPYKKYAKGEEKGYFSLGASCIVMIFEPRKIVFDADLLEASHKKMETYALFGESMGTIANR